MESQLEQARTILSKYNFADVLDRYTAPQIGELIDKHVRPHWSKLDTFAKAKAYLASQYGPFALCMFHETDLAALYRIAVDVLSCGQNVN